MPPQDPAQARWFAEHLQVHEALLRAWLRRRFPQCSEIDDVVQEAYTRVLTAHASGQLRSPKAFFFAVARNLAIDRVRRWAPGRSTELSSLDDLSVLEDDEDIAETVSRHEEIELMTQAIQSLPRRCRQVMTLRNVYGLPQKEIARQLGISVRTVEAQIGIGVKLCTRFVARLRDR